MTSKRLPDYQRVEGFILPTAFDPQAFQNTMKFKAKKGDIVLATYPKSGTNWMQQILLLLNHKGEPPKNFDEFMAGCPHVELSGPESVKDSVGFRLYRSHLPFSLIPYSSKAKYIYVVRNPKDCLVSFYHQTASAIYDFIDGDFDVFFDIFMRGENDFGCYFEHALSWYEHRDDPNVLTIYFEEMKQDLKASIVRVAGFLGPSYEALIKDESILQKILHCSSFVYMKNTFDEGLSKMPQMSPEVDLETQAISRSLKYFFNYVRNRMVEKDQPVVQLVRKGVVGGWRTNFSIEQNNRMNETIEEKLKGTRLLDFWRSINCL